MRPKARGIIVKYRYFGVNFRKPGHVFPILAPNYSLPLRSENLFTLRQKVACESIRFSSLFAAGVVSRGGTFPLRETRPQRRRTRRNGCFRMLAKRGTELIQYVKLLFRDRRGATSLRYRNCVEITVLMCKQSPYPV